MTSKIIILILFFFLIIPNICNADIDNSSGTTDYSPPTGTEWWGQAIFIDDGNNQLDNIKLWIARLSSPTSNLKMEICKASEFNVNTQTCQIPLYQKFLTTTDINNLFVYSGSSLFATSSWLLDSSICLIPNTSYFIGFRASSTVNNSFSSSGVNTNTIASSTLFGSGFKYSSTVGLVAGGQSGGYPYLQRFVASTSYNTLCENNECEECGSASSTECKTTPIFISSTIIQIFIVSLIVFISGLLILSSRNYAVQ